MTLFRKSGSHDPFFTHNPRPMIVFDATTGVARRTNLQAEHWFGQADWTAEDLSTALDWTARLAAAKGQTVEGQDQPAGEGWFNWQAWPSGRPNEWVVAFEDVTEQAKQRHLEQRVLSMVEEMPINVMFCDPETLTIQYANKTSIETLGPLAKLLPVKPEKLVGQCIDIFHKNPAHPRKVLADPANLPHTARIKLGPETLDLKVSAIMSSSGEYLGPMLTWDVITDHVNITDNLDNGVKRGVDVIAQAVAELEASATEMAANTSSTVDQAGNVSVACEELTSSISEISSQVSRSSQIATSAVGQADDTSRRITELSEAADKIGNVVNMIRDIADQTNLLALNATIEAARAGEAGKGFAVVASEVKSLAEQTGRATGEISDQIAAIQGATSGSVVAIEEISSTIRNINEIVGGIAAAIEEQSAATNEVAGNISGVLQGTDATSAVAEQIRASSGQLREESISLKGEVETVVGHMRAM